MRQEAWNMTISNREAGSRPHPLFLLCAMLLLLSSVFVVAPGTPGARDVQVIVGMAEGATTDPAAVIDEIGGEYLQGLPIINGFSAVIPADKVDQMLAHPAVASVVADGSLEILEDGWDNASTVALTDLGTYPGSMGAITETTIHAEKFWLQGYVGQGIDVALIDSGVVVVPGLSAPGKIVNGPDLSFESQSDDLRYLDAYGHGTHLAGIIAGDDGTAGGFKGVAPGSRIVNIKVANYEGAVDVSQVIAAIDWAVQHRNDRGMNIRVINLAYGTDSTQSALLDPLSFAVEQAWRAGIVVVVAAGNDGNSHGLRNPAFNPYVIAVGASDSNSTEKPKDDFVTDFTNCGSSARYVDVLAPGRSIVSLRNPGSFADVNHPEARIGSSYFLGSGTSQASAVVAGAVALILDKYPAATPDEVKAYLMASGTPLVTKNKYCSAAHLIDLEPPAGDKHLQELSIRLQPTNQYSAGTGTLEGARGSHHVAVDGVVLKGEQDIFGQSWNGEYWAKLAANQISWDGGDWNGSTWTGTSWSGTSWSGTSWSGTSWSGTSWSESGWLGLSWGRKELL